MTWREHLEAALTLDKEARRHLTKYIMGGCVDAAEFDAYEALDAQARKHQRISNRAYGRVTACLRELH